MGPVPGITLRSGESLRDQLRPSRRRPAVEGEPELQLQRAKPTRARPWPRSVSLGPPAPGRRTLRGCRQLAQSQPAAGLSFGLTGGT